MRQTAKTKNPTKNQRNNAPIPENNESKQKPTKKWAKHRKQRIKPKTNEKMRQTLKTTNPTKNQRKNAPNPKKQGI